MRQLLSTKWIAGHLLAVIGIVVFVSLGFWQLRRLDDRRTFNESVEAAVASSAVGLDEALAADGVYVRVEVAGSFDVTAEVLVLRARSEISGYHVLTPLVMDDGRGVLVDRGWVPLEFDTTPVIAARPPAGPVTVVGILWPAEDGAPVDELPEVIRRIDPATVDPFVDADLVEPYLVLESPSSTEFPIPAGAPELTEGTHFSYAVQWFLFAAVVVVGYPILLRRTIRS